MKRLLIVVLVLCSVGPCHGQLGYLFVKKGVRKVRTYAEGDRILLRLNDEQVLGGVITLLKNDTIWLNGVPVPRVAVVDVLLNNRRKKHFDIGPEELLLITGGVALVVTGLTLSKQAKFGEAVVAGTVIGYGPLLLKYLGSKINLRRRRYHIGGKYRLTMLEFHLPYKRAF